MRGRRRGAVNVTFEEIEFRYWLENVGERRGGGRRRLKMMSKFTASAPPETPISLRKYTRTHKHTCVVVQERR